MIFIKIKIIKNPILNKLRPGNRCRYIGENNDFGFIQGKEYFIIERLPTLVAFSNKQHIGVDYGLLDDGEYFFKNWQVLNKTRLLNQPDFEYEQEKDYCKYIKAELHDLNCRVE